ncbi:hypothetical protein [Enterococcus phage PEF1]
MYSLPCQALNSTFFILFLVRIMKLSFNYLYYTM